MVCCGLSADIKMVEAAGIDTENLLAEFHQVYLRCATATRVTRALIRTATNKKGLPCRATLVYLVEAAGIEPASASPPPLALHAYPCL